MLKRLKELSFLYWIICLTTLIAVTLLMKGIIIEWNLNTPVDKIVITKKLAITLPFSISYNCNFLTAIILSILFYFLLPKELLQNSKEQSGSKGFLVAIFLISLAVLIFNPLASSIVFFLLFYILHYITTIGLMDTELNLENLDNSFFYKEAQPPEDLLEFDYKLSERALNRYSLITFLLFHFSICLLKGVVTGIFFILAFIFLTLMLMCVFGFFAKEKETNGKVSMAVEN